MQSRMEKYNSNDSKVSSRTQKNQSLYEEVRNTTLTDFDVNSNVSIIEEDASSIDVRKVRKFLDEKYNDDAPKRRSIEVPEFDEPIIEEPLQDTKEYDINAILEKAKKGKNVDYSKERLKKIRDAQYEILNNLDLELKKVEEAKVNHVRKEEEDNLINLINTITELEIKNKTNISKEASGALDLLSDLKDDSDEEAAEPDVSVAEAPEESKEETDSDDETGIEEEVIKEEKEEENKKEEHIEETLNKLDIDVSKYDDFADVAKKDTGVLFLKIIIFLLVIALVIGAVYILDGILELGLFVK